MVIGNLRKRPRPDPLFETRPSDLVEGQEQVAWEIIQRLQKKVKELQSQVRQIRQATPPSNTFVSIKQHKRPAGKSCLTEERKALLRCYEICRGEKEHAKLVTTSDPLLRTTFYVGYSINTVNNTVLRRDNRDT
ncbi:hypothetical protein BC939DRAFT_21586 [Gamsiella multidivaricata]|uniref:uncharacterized protein n=1 Tax=Gamsiella multidivaricata TaxID=101098 RepID=UPI0022207483|nr:uncharacterized protein BC939DRAFT_21586 [Gamsiella multidivaricata]KAI7816928.1 hypothetical protein BC939DRAFT_21586 [Gamsiella multidivaricata]